jgi:two-component system, NarL family, invasion response regulator UvrY
LARGLGLGTLRVMTTVEVITVDDEESFRRAARAVVNATPSFEQVGEAASAEEAIEAAVALRPDLVLVAVALPGLDGFETSRRLAAAVPEAVLVLVHDGNEPDVNAIRASGAAGFLPKEALTATALQALWDEHRQD